MATTAKPKSKETEKSKINPTKSSKSKRVEINVVKKGKVSLAKNMVNDIIDSNKNTTDSMKKTVKKKVEINVTKYDLIPFTFEQMLEKSFGKKGTEERDKADVLINEGVAKLLADVQAKLKQEKEPKIILEEKKAIDPIVPKGIIPADFVPENKNSENKENLPSRPIQLHREFVVHQGAEFLKGDLKIQENDTKIARIKDTEYIIYKNIGNPNAFTTPFKCVDLAEAEVFLDELIDYENKIKNTKMENEPKQENPTQEVQKNEVISEEQKKEIINKYEGLPLQEVDIKELIKAAGEAPTNSNPIANQVAQNNFSNAQTLSQMESYGETIAGLINQKHWMKMSTTDVNRLLSNQCSKLYSYLLKNDGQGYYIEISQGNVKTRAPKDPNSFLNVA